MADREKVVQALEMCTKPTPTYCRQCPYKETPDNYPHCVHQRLQQDALSLLKEQDAVWLDKTDIDEVYLLWECSRCGHKSPDEHRYRYCPHCGARMNVERSERT